MPDTPAGSYGSGLWAMVAEHAAGRGQQVGVVDAVSAAVTATRVSGAGLTMMTRAESGRVVCVTDTISAKVEELQVTCGEGPCMDAYFTRSPVLSPDLGAVEAIRRWPAFAPAASSVGAAAVFAFPLQMGAVRLGVMDLYHSEPRHLASDELRDALLLAETATLLLVGRDKTTPDDPEAEAHGDLLSEREGYRAEIDQATGMVSVQLDVKIDDAFARLRAYAYAKDRSLTDVARDVVARRLRFTPDTAAGPENPTTTGGENR